MGQVISLDEHRAASVRPRRGSADRPGRRTTFHFELDSPLTYLAAERVERQLPGVEWRPVVAPQPLGDDRVLARRTEGGLRDEVERRAATLGLPLLWPDPRGAAAPRARRIAAFAASAGHGAAAFTLAAGRLAFCGGFHLDDPEVLAEAAAAAKLDLAACLHAALDPAHDRALRAAGHAIAAAGATRLPVLQVGATLFCGEHRVPEAVAAARAGRPAPVGRLYSVDAWR